LAMGLRRLRLFQGTALAIEARSRMGKPVWERR